MEEGKAMFTRARLSRWTDALRKNPEQQFAGQLANKDYTKFCCLGKLCEVEGIKRTFDPAEGYWDATFGPWYWFEDASLPQWLTLEMELKSLDPGEFPGFPGSGNFRHMGMPDLRYNDCLFVSAAAANDSQVPWGAIADHFDLYYPCSDEQTAVPTALKIAQ